MSSATKDLVRAFKFDDQILWKISPTFSFRLVFLMRDITTATLNEHIDDYVGSSIQFTLFRLILLCAVRKKKSTANKVKLFSLLESSLYAAESDHVTSLIQITLILFAVIITYSRPDASCQSCESTGNFLCPLSTHAGEQWYCVVCGGWKFGM